MGLIQMFSNCQERNIAERDRAEITQVAVGENHARDNIRIHAVIRTPVIGVWLQGGGGYFAESCFGGGAVSGRVAYHEVRTEAGEGTVERLMFKTDPLNGYLIIIHPIQQPVLYVTE